MTQRNTIARSLHDLGLAAWFGGSLMGAAGLDAAAAQLSSPEERSRITTTAWGRWGPINVAAAVAYMAGGARLASANKARLLAQRGVGTTTGAKVALTAVALGTSGYASWEGMRAAGGQLPADESRSATGQGDQLGATTRQAAERTDASPEDAAQARSRLRMAGWAVPAATGALIVVSAYQGEQQRLSQVVTGVVRGAPNRAAAARKAAGKVPVAKVAKAGAKVGARRRYRRPLMKAAKVAAKRRVA